MQGPLAKIVWCYFYEMWISQASALEPDTWWLPFLQREDPINWSLTSLIIVTSCQKRYKWQKLKCVFFFLDMDVTTSPLEPKKSWCPFPQSKAPNNGNLTSFVIVTTHQKCVKEHWLIVCGAMFLRCECHKLSLGTWKSCLPFSQPKDPRNWSLKCRIIVTIH